MYDLKRKTSPVMNNILLLHSEWLEKEGLTQRAKECRKQALTFRNDKDWRQAKGRRRNERQVKNSLNSSIPS